MEETAKPISKKRNRRSLASDHFTGTFTRSKSEIYVHYNRSGRSRFDSTRHIKHQADLRMPQALFSSKTQLQSIDKIARRMVIRDVTQESASADDLSGTLIKDLRTRRVFSPASVDNDCGLDVDGEETKESEELKGQDSCDNQNLKRENPNSLFDEEGVKENSLISVKVGEEEDIIKLDGGDSYREQSVNDVCTNFAVIEEKGRTSAGDGENSSGFVDLDDESVQATPPDDVMFSCTYKNGGNQVEFFSPNMEHVSQTPMTKSKDFKDDKSDKKNSEAKPVLSSMSRVRVLKTPGSVSYRRLLPYLMDMAKDNPYCPQQGSFTNAAGQKMFTERLDANHYSITSHVGGSETLSQGVQISAIGLPDGSNLDPTSVQQMTDSSMLCGSQSDPCMRVCSSISLIDKCCSKSIVNEGNVKIEVEVYGKEKVLNNTKAARASSLDNCHFSGHLNDTKPVDNGQDNLPSVVNHQLGEGDENCRRSGTTIVSNCLDVNLPDTEQIGHSLNTEKKDDERGDVLYANDYSIEESIQVSPPDDNFGKPEASGNIDHGVKCVLQGADRVPSKSMDRCSQINNSFVGARRMDSSPNTKLGLNSCSRPKLFKIPSSLNYRRLLPYLMGITKDNAGNGHCRKLENSSEERPLAEKVDSDHHGTHMETVDWDSHMAENNTDDSHTMQVPSVIAVHASSNDQPNVLSPECNTALQPFGSVEERELQVVDVTSDKDRHSKGASDVVSSINGSNSPTSPLCSISSPISFGADSLNLVPRELLFDNEGGCVASAVKLTTGLNAVKADIFSRNSPQKEGSDSLGISFYGCKKSILKRNPRGCRGLCTCLNCASFYLHAERAFEFTKNQMQDAEEVALDLIRELSHVRNMLEKSVSGSDVCINQVKEACRKATEAEEAAKSRISQMNCDLNIHCRIPCGQRPRVTFADTVEERVIPSID